jgi:hypothetical protein
VEEAPDVAGKLVRTGVGAVVAGHSWQLVPGSYPGVVALGEAADRLEVAVGRGREPDRNRGRAGLDVDGLALVFVIVADRRARGAGEPVEGDIGEEAFAGAVVPPPLGRARRHEWWRAPGG